MLYGGHVRKIDDIQRLKDLGFDFGEVVLGDYESLLYWKLNGKRFERKDGFFMLAHGPHEGNPNNIENIYNNYLPALKDTVLTLGQMGVDFLTIHMWMDSRHVLPEIIISKIAAFGEIQDFGKKEGVTVSLENLSESAFDFSRIISSIPDLSLTLDVGHGQLLTDKNRSFEIIRHFRQSVKHVHVHDNRGGNSVRDDLHLPVGEGIIDFEGIFLALIESGYNGTITLELEPDELEVSLEFTRQMVSHIINEKCM